MFEVTYKFIIILLIILLGYIARKLNIFANKDGEALSRFVFNFTLPAVIISVFKDVVFEFNYLIFPATGVFLGMLMLAVSFFVFRNHPRKERGMLTMPLLGINLGIFAVPLVHVIWGDIAVKYLLLMDFGNAFIIFVVCYFVGAMYANENSEPDIKYISRKIVRSVPLIIYFITIILKFTGLYYPAFITDIAELGAKANTPVSMFTLGLFLSFSFDKSQTKNLIKFWLTKYIVGIILAVAAFLFLPIGNAEKAVIMMAFILPASFSVIPYSVEFGYDNKFVAALVNSSILISIVFMWFLALIIDF